MVDEKELDDIDILNWWIEICDGFLSGQFDVVEYCALINGEAVFGSIGKAVPAYYAIVNQLAYDAYEYTPCTDSGRGCVEHEKQIRSRISFANDAMKVLRSYLLHMMERSEQ